MLTIICGEDNISSRNYFISLKNNYKNKNYQIIEIEPNQIEEIVKWQSQAQSLFKPQIVFFIENLFQKYLNKKRDLKSQIIKKLNLLKEEIFDWEDQISSYELNLKQLTIKEFKPPASIFTLLDNLYPGNLKNFYKIFTQIIKRNNEALIFYMIIKHTKNIILVKENQPISFKNFWQEKKIRYLAKLWPSEKLIEFYDGLFRIDMLIKTSSTPFSIKESLDILLCYYL